MLKIETVSESNLDYSDYNEWNDLCNKCSSIVAEAGMTDDDIDDIVRKVKNGTLK